MTLRLFDAIQRETSSFSTNVYISKDATRAFAVYQLTANNTNSIVAELFDITNGKLETLFQYKSDLLFPIVESGTAAKDFSMFSIVEMNESNNFRVTLLDSKLVPIVTRIGPGTSKGFTTIGGTFTPDNSAIIVTTVSADTLPNQQSTLYLLSTTNLGIIASLVVSKIFAVIASSFSVCNKQYFAIASSQGVLDFNDLPANWKPTHQLEVYRIDNTRLTLVSTAILPQGAMTVSAQPKKHSVLISVGTSTALIPKCPNVRIKDATNRSATIDNSELRIYKFIHEELCLKRQINTDTIVETAHITNAGDLIISQNTLPYSEFGPSVVQLKKGLALPTNGLVNLDSDKTGTHLILGSALEAGTPSASNNNVLLLKIIS